MALDARYNPASGSIYPFLRSANGLTASLLGGCPALARPSGMDGPRQRLATRGASHGVEPPSPAPSSAGVAAGRAARKHRMLLAVTGVLLACLLLQVALQTPAPRFTGKERRSGRKFGEFWPFYMEHIQRHDHPHARALHVVGTSMAVLLGIFQPGERHGAAREPVSREIREGRRWAVPVTRAWPCGLQRPPAPCPRSLPRLVAGRWRSAPHAVFPCRSPRQLRRRRLCRLHHFRHLLPHPVLRRCRGGRPRRRARRGRTAALPPLPRRPRLHPRACLRRRLAGRRAVPAARAPLCLVPDPGAAQ